MVPAADRAEPAARTAAQSLPSAGTCSPSPATTSAFGRSPERSCPLRAPVEHVQSSPPSASSHGHPVVQSRVEVCQITRWSGFGRRSPQKLAYSSTPMHKLRGTNLPCLLCQIGNGEGIQQHLLFVCPALVLVDNF